MDAFITKRKRTTDPTHHVDDAEPTEVKLAILSSLYPDFPPEALLDVLLEHDGSVSDASASLLAPELSLNMSPRSRPSSRKVASAPAVVSQTSLRNFVAPRPPDDYGAPAGAPAAKKTRLMSRKGATLHLFDPEDIEEHTPCSIIHNFLPSDLANDLLNELLEEAKSFERNTFKLFDNVVSSPHSSSFYVDSLDEVQRQKSEYLYNGSRITDVRKITPQLDRAKPLVREAVNREIQRRIRTRYPGGTKLKHQAPQPWSPNAAFVNCYDGPAESVGWHSDQLTYLGPRAVIGSLSLGVAREFRVRRVVMPPEDGDAEAGDAAGQVAIHLPHNSLLVMHAEMQEAWKHCIAPARAVDPHPLAGNRRVNVTYRDYKAALHPRHTPRCACGVPTVLRVVQKRRENWGRYFWMCHAGNVPGRENCAFFRWAEFDDDGNPIWNGKGESTGQPLKGRATS
ncbi:hypothetical protein VSDG_00073 [Cytospora chrysosperma]|uniref:Fe2OG dioxygenase domain-containing protein n=1 Tax=Cytospora chrysosperma TaxID=252740 RepID=A0A423WQ38_CYTCH|nr:hypothetical protein VSDG_00073 [Valsa sordida]